MRSVIYLRISEQDTLQSSRKQLREMQALIAKYGWKNIHIYRDTAGSKTDRTGYQKMLSDAQEHRFDVLVFWSLDQIQHGLRNTMLLLQKLSSWDVVFCSCTEPHLDSCHSQAITSILDSMAQQNHAHISKRTLAGLKRQQQTGQPGPKGYTAPGRPKITFNRERALAWRKNNKSYAEIALACGVSKATIQRFFKKVADGE